MGTYISKVAGRCTAGANCKYYYRVTSVMTDLVFFLRAVMTNLYVKKVIYSHSGMIVMSISAIVAFCIPINIWVEDGQVLLLLPIPR